MGSDWPEIPVADVCNIFLGGTPKRSEPTYWGGSIKWASAKDVANCRTRYLTFTEETITQKGLDNSAAKLLDKNTIVITARGTVGALCMLGEPMSFNQTCYGLVGLPGTSSHYLYYALKAAIAQIRSISYGTVFDTITMKSFTNLMVPLPSRDQQLAIAHILGSLDDKIELNRRMNKTLESMARAIFKSWFVDFDPVRAKAEGRDTGLPEEIAELFPDSFEDSELGEIPAGWESRSLYESAKYINGAAYRNSHFTDEEGALPVVKIAELKNGVTGQTKFTKTELDDKYRISDGEILLSWSGNPDTSIGTFVWCGGPAWLNQHIFRVLPYQAIEKHFVFYLLKYLRPVFAEIARDKQTTGLGHFTVRDMKQLIVVHPPKKLLVTFNDFVGPIFDQSYGNLFESNTLASLGYTLLPRLISGELRVPDAEKFVEEAGV